MTKGTSSTEHLSLDECSSKDDFIVKCEKKIYYLLSPMSLISWLEGVISGKMISRRENN